MAGHGSVGRKTHGGGRARSQAGALTRSHLAFSGRYAHASSTGASRSLRLRG